MWLQMSIIHNVSALNLCDVNVKNASRTRRKDGKAAEYVEAWKES